MTRQPFKARSAGSPMIFPALEMHYPQRRRIVEDPYAIATLSPGLRLTVRAMRWSWLRGRVARSLDKQFPGIWGGMVARKRYADEKTAEALDAGIRQFVILGAGLDTRAVRLIAPAGAEAFEVDLPDNSARKTQVLHRLFGKVPDRVRLVSMDFEVDDLAESLAAKGFRSDEPAMFILEGVSQYLTDDAVERLFTHLAGAPASSQLIFTYVRKDFLNGDNLYGWDNAYRKWVVEDKVWTYGCDPATVGELLRQHGWTEIEQAGSAEYRTRYFEPAGRRLTAMDIERFVHAELGRV